MGRIFYIMGKSATGKDTVFKELLKRRPELTTVVPYTTRPIREGETDGVEYFFTSSEKLEQFKNSGKIVELRTYETVMGPWSYFTMDDGQFDIHGEGDCLMIGTLESYEKTRNYFGKEYLRPIYITVENGLRLQRALDREKRQPSPRYDEVCRRYLADEQDFCQERLNQCGIEQSYDNENLSVCLEKIVGEISRDCQ